MDSNHIIPGMFPIRLFLNEDEEYRPIINGKKNLSEEDLVKYKNVFFVYKNTFIFDKKYHKLLFETYVNKRGGENRFLFNEGHLWEMEGSIEDFILKHNDKYIMVFVLQDGGVIRTIDRPLKEKHYFITCGMFDIYDGYEYKKQEVNDEDEYWVNKLKNEN